MSSRLPLAVFLLTLACFVAALCPGAYWLDSSEFAAGSFLLGVAHPPGHPLSLLLGKLVTLLPLGPVSLRVGLGQALCGALAAAIMAVLATEVAARARRALLPASPESSPLDALLGTATALCTSLGYAWSFQSVRPEVYALHRLVALGGLLYLCRYDAGRGGSPGFAGRGGRSPAEPPLKDRRALALGAFCLGLGLANHHLLALLMAAPCLVLVLRGPGLGRVLLLGTAAGAIGLLLYAYLPLRGAHHGLVNWGAPTDWSRFFWTLSAKAFQKSVRAPEGGSVYVLGAMAEQVHPMGVGLAGLGLYGLLRHAATRRLGACLLLCLGLHAGVRASLGFDLANPDAYAYLGPGMDALALLACAGAATALALVARAGRERVARWLGVGFALSWSLWGASSLPRAERSGFWDLDRLLGQALRESPPRARLFSTYFQTVFGLWYLQGVEGQRPDVEHIHPHFLPNPGYLEDVLWRAPDEPELRELLGQRVHVPSLIASAARRPVRWEYDFDTPAALVAALVPDGLDEAVLPQGPPADVRERARRAEAERGALAAELLGADLSGGEPETRRVVVWHAYLGAMLACAQGDAPRYRQEQARARQLLGPGPSPEMEAVERRCAALLEQ